jgi:hypothetical protein
MKYLRRAIKQKYLAQRAAESFKTIRGSSPHYALFNYTVEYYTAQEMR